MSSSTAPQAKGAILAILQGHVPLADVACSWGGPVSEESIRDEMVFFGDLEQTEEYIGPSSIDEDYDLTVIIQVRTPGDDEQATETRAWDIRREVRAALEADGSLGGLLNIGCEVSRTVSESGPLTDGWFARLRVTVHCQARLPNA